MTPRRRFLICLALLIALAAALPAGGAAASSPARAWLTTGDGANLLAEQPPDALGAPAPAAPMIAVDPSRSYQRIAGLGASITDSSAHLIAHSPDRDAIMRSLARLAVIVGRELQRAGLQTKILGYDHNWSLHPNDVGPPDDPANPEYARSLLSDPDARRYLAGTAFHCYFGDPERQSALHDLFPEKDVYFTECSGTQSANPATTFPDTLHWHTRYWTVGAATGAATPGAGEPFSYTLPAGAVATFVLRP